MPLKLNVAYSPDNPRVEPLKDGTVKPEGIELNFVNMGGGWIFHRNLYYDEFDVSEMSISSLMLAKERGDGKKWDWSGIPVFLLRGHPWEFLYVNTSSGINSLADLKGKRIAIPDYEMTAALWLKIVMKDMCGIEAGDNVWYNGRTAAMSRDAAIGLDRDPVPGVERKWLTEEQYMDVMLDRGEVDAAMILLLPRMEVGVTQTMDRYGGTPLTGNPRIRKMFDDNGRQLIYDYYKQTGFYQANHTLIVQNRILKQHPWAALELLKAFQRSKEVAYERAKQYAQAYLYFPEQEFAPQAKALGDDPYPMGIGVMRKNIERMIQGSVEQGLLRKPLKVEDLYFHTTLDS